MRIILFSFFNVFITVFFIIYTSFFEKSRLKSTIFFMSGEVYTETYQDTLTNVPVISERACFRRGSPHMSDSLSGAGEGRAGGWSGARKGQLGEPQPLRRGGPSRGGGSASGAELGFRVCSQRIFISDSSSSPPSSGNDFKAGLQRERERRN